MYCVNFNAYPKAVQVATRYSLLITLVVAERVATTLKPRSDFICCRGRHMRAIE